jgi:MoaA/NifB/PqqE/SkfB family radical SAM enzyme
MKKLPTLTYKQKLLLIDKLKKSLGPFYLSLNGGELFLDKSIFKFIAYCEKNDIQLSIVTNGTLIDEKVAKQISQFSNLKIIISLDGARPGTHDLLRGVKGTYQKVMNAIDNLHKNNFYKIGIHTVISSQNIEELSDLVDVCIDKNIKEINFQPINLGTNPNLKKHVLWPKKFVKVKSNLNKLILLKDTDSGKIISNKKEEIARIIKYFKNPYDKSEKCYVSDKAIRIDRCGNLYLCMGIKESYGNLLKDDLRSILNSQNKKMLNEKIKTCNLPCKFMTCNRKRDWGFYFDKLKRYL